MAIEIPPPKGGPAVFGSSSPGHESPLDMSPEGEGFRTPELGEDLIDGGSLCLSEGEKRAKNLTHTHAHNHQSSASLMRNTVFFIPRWHQ